MACMQYTCSIDLVIHGQQVDIVPLYECVFEDEVSKDGEKGLGWHGALRHNSSCIIIVIVL